MPIEQNSPKEPSPSLPDRKPEDKAPNPVSASAARRIVRKAMKATMASLEKATAAPYASLVAVATKRDGTPILAMSSLSHHHANISADPTISLLFDGTPQIGDALEGGRVSISGSLELAKDKTAKRRFMARHPDAYYTDFADFGFFTLNINRVHYIAGFGQVRWFKQDDFLLGDELKGSEEDAISHITSEQRASVAALAHHSWETSIDPLASGKLSLGEGESWQLCGLDPEGADLIANGRAARLDFAQKITSTKAALQQITQMIEQQ